MFKRIYFFYLTYLVAMVYSQTLLMLWFFKNGISFAEMFFLFYFINLERPCSDAVSYSCLLPESLFKKINFISHLLRPLESLPHLFRLRRTDPACYFFWKILKFFIHFLYLLLLH